MLRPPALLTFVAAFLGLAGSAQATTYDVTTTLDPAGACATPPVGCSLRQALAAINAAPSAPDVINLPAGGYQNTQSAQFATDQDVAIRGAGAATTTINGSATSRVIAIGGVGRAVTISGVTITGGNAATANGGGVFVNASAALTLDRVAVVGNSARSGGGVLPASGGGGKALITNSLIAGNTATAPTGIGGGIAAASDVTVLDSTITANTAGDGTGAAVGGGVAITGQQTAATISGSTIAGNTVKGAGSRGGNVSADINDDIYGFANTIVAGGTAPSAGTENCYLATGVAVMSNGHNLEDRDQCRLSTSSGDRVAIDPMLGSLASPRTAASTLALLPGSPAINAGGSGQCDPNDQRGLPRPAGTACDIGAFEFQVPVVTSATATGTPAVGASLTCSVVSSSPDGPASTAVSWLRDGADVATGSGYTPVAADAGHAIACRATVSNAAGAAVRTSDARNVPAAAAPPGTPPMTPTTPPGQAPPVQAPPVQAPQPAPTAPELTLAARKRALRTVRASRGFLVAVKCDVACQVGATVKLGSATIGSGRRSLPAGKTVLVRVRLSRAGLARLRGRRSATFAVSVTATAAGGERSRRSVRFTAR